MLDGRIDVQGPVAELQAGGVLDDLDVQLISHADKNSNDPDEEEDPAQESEDDKRVVIRDDEWIRAQQNAEKTRKRPRKLIEEETRRLGNVQWSIYETYLRAS